ncbi:MAG: phosphopantothenoylcysteine decarboxylase, partial [Mycobacteriales bacterium]
VEIAATAASVLARGVVAPDLGGRRVVVTAGGTREHLDPVRYLGNRSSGRQGAALARAAAARGADVTLVAAALSVPAPAGVKVVPVTSAADLREATLSTAAGADAVVMAAAVADFRPAVRSDTKIKKGAQEPTSVELVRTADVLAELAAQDAGSRARVVVGFAAETDDVLTHGRVKLAAKGCDLLVVNRVGDGVGFEVDRNAATILAADGVEVQVADTTKDLLAHAVWDAVATRLA